MNDLEFCIDYLKKYNNIKEEFNEASFDVFRALMNITLPYSLSDEFYQKQDKVLTEINIKKGIIDAFDFKEIENKISLIKADITTIKADAIVDACNEKLLGCFIPLHHCIDNAIHSFAGLEVRRDLLKIMNKQNHDEKNGQCKVSKAYNLPSKFIFHTVGPKVDNIIKKEDEIDLKNCYLSCLKMMDKMNLNTIVFPSISTGLYGFPIVKASEIAVKTVKEYLLNSNIKKVIFDCFSEEDYEIYYRTIKEIYKRS